MNLQPEHIADYNQTLLEGHQRKLSYWTQEVAKAEPIIQKLIDFQIAIPSWALGTGGTRFGRFPGGGEPRSLEEKIADVGLLHALNAQRCHIPAHPLGYSNRPGSDQTTGGPAWPAV